MNRSLFICFLYFVLCITNSVAQEYAVITPENANQLEYVGKLGRGYVTNIEFKNDETIEIGNVFGDKWQYAVNDMEIPPHFQPAKIPPVKADYQRIDYPFHLSSDGNWSVTHDGIRSIETNESVFEYEGFGSVREHVMASNYLIIWRTNYRTKSESRCSQDNSCTNQVIIINMFTKQLYGEILSDNIVNIDIALNSTHVAIKYDDTTDFYSLFNPSQLEFAFTIPTQIKYINESGTHGIAQEWQDNHLYVWNLETRSQVFHITYQVGEYIWGYNLSSDGRYLAVISQVELDVEATNYSNYQDKNVGLWDIQTGQQLAIIPYYAPRSTLNFSDDGQYFVIYSQSDAFFLSDKGIYFITLFETQTGRQITQIENGYSRPTSDVAFSPDGKHLAIAYYDGRIILLEMGTGKILADHQGYGGYFTHIHLHDGKVILSSEDNYSDWWNLHTIEHVDRTEDCQILGINSVSEQITCLSYWLNESSRTPLRLQQLTTEETIFAKDERLSFDWLLNITFSSDGKQFVTQGNYESDQPHVWDATTLNFISTLESNYIYDIRNFQYLSDGAFIGSQSHGVIWDAQTFEIVAEFPSIAGINSRGVYSEIGDWVAFPDIEENNITIWRLSDLYTNLNPEPMNILSGYDDYEYILSASPNGQLLAITDNNLTTLVEMETFSVVHQYYASGLEVKFSPDGRYIIHTDGICLAYGADESLHIGSAQIWAVPAS